MRKIHFVCQNCGYESPRWLGRCPNCESWNTLTEEEVVPKKSPRSKHSLETPVSPKRLAEMSLTPIQRLKTGIDELDRVLGGGIVPGSLLLLGGEPGIGKSTLLLQVCRNLARNKISVLYVTGEESADQVRLRAERLDSSLFDIFVLCTISLEDVIQGVNQVNPKILVIDSIQTLMNPELTSAQGSVTQVRDCTAELLKLAKTERITIFIVGHVTKFGLIAGPKTLEHMVDTVLYFEGETTYNYRIIRTVKNRYGPTNEIGVFEMTDIGLKEVTNPSELFLPDQRRNVSGSVVVATLEGTRPLLVEIQALAAPTPFPLPQRIATGFDLRRLSLLLGILERRAGINSGNRDIFLNVAGGLKLTEPAVDLGVICTLASALRNVPLPADTVVIGEVGLAGEIRTVSRIESRLNEAQKLGFKRALLPPNFTKLKKMNIELVPVETINSALKYLGVKK